VREEGDEHIVDVGLSSSDVVGPLGGRLPPAGYIEGREGTPGSGLGACPFAIGCEGIGDSLLMGSLDLLGIELHLVFLSGVTSW